MCFVEFSLWGHQPVMCGACVIFWAHLEHWLCWQKGFYAPLLQETLPRYCLLPLCAQTMLLPLLEQVTAVVAVIKRMRIKRMHRMRLMPGNCFVTQHGSTWQGAVAFLHAQLLRPNGKVVPEVQHARGGVSV